MASAISCANPWIAEPTRSASGRLLARLRVAAAAASSRRRGSICTPRAQAPASSGGFSGPKLGGAPSSLPVSRPLDLRVETTDFLVVGSGIAGLTYALKVAEYGRVTILTKSTMDEGSTRYAQASTRRLCWQRRRDPVRV